MQYTPLLNFQPDSHIAFLYLVERETQDIFFSETRAYCEFNDIGRDSGSSFQPRLSFVRKNINIPHCGFGKLLQTINRILFDIFPFYSFIFPYDKF